MNLRTLLCVAVIGAVVGSTPGDAQQQRVEAQSISLDSLLNTRISAASKYAQTTAEAPASVTILTSEDLQRYGYRTLAEALESVRGFYLTYDRNYPYLGTRGFSRPSDYNNRVLVLIDGHSLNDATWGGAPVGSDLPIDFDAVERIEVVRGPGSALYGSSAVFSVINIVTKTGPALDGATLGARVGTGRAKQATMAAGHSLGTNASFAASGLVSRIDGTDHYYHEFDSPASNSGIAHRLDWENSVSGLGALTVRDATLRVGYRSRAKGVPTAPFGSAFDDPRSETVDETLWGELADVHEFDSKFRLSTRLYGDRYRYRGVYPEDAGPAYSDGGGSGAIGAEALAIWEPISRNSFTVGSEFRRVLRANYYERMADGSITQDNVLSNVAALFAQDEFQLSSAFTFVAGLRHDQTTRHGHALSPRLALIATPDRATTVKLLYGEAFRAPSPAEADLTTSYYTSNPTLAAEGIRTIELVALRRIGEGLFLSGSVYGYGVRNLIDQVSSDTAGFTQFRNVARSEGSGIELEADFRPAGPLAFHGAYAFQHADDEPTNVRMTNSPQQIGTASITTRSVGGIRSAVSWRYESGRRTIDGSSTAAFLRTDANLSYAPHLRNAAGSEVGFRVTNLFDVRYATPVGGELRQNSIAQDGRALSLQITVHF